jgi:hypothetical protein
MPLRLAEAWHKNYRPNPGLLLGQKRSTLFELALEDRQLWRFHVVMAGLVPATHAAAPRRRVGYQGG